MKPARRHDLALFGATGFTGSLVAEYLAQHAPDGLRWTLVGRDLHKLEALRERLAAIDSRWHDLPLTRADVNDPAALRALAADSRVVLSTVGPFLRYGEPLVAACAAAGTDYADITGEPEFVDRCWLRYHEAALASGARLVHCCGFDSIPADLGAFFTAGHFAADARLRVTGTVRVQAKFSSGTFRSAVEAVARMRQMRQVAAERRRRERGSTPAARRVRGVAGWLGHHRGGGWHMPLPTIDPQIVLRSARALERYGQTFEYRHQLWLPRLRMLLKLLGGLTALLVAVRVPALRRRLLARAPLGQGPSPERRARSSFAIDFDAVDDHSGRRLHCRVSGGDPGYTETSRMLAEVGLCLAGDTLPARAGQLTPATAMGEALLLRLQRAGLRFETLETPT